MSETAAYDCKSYYQRLAVMNEADIQRVSDLLSGERLPDEDDIQNFLSGKPIMTPLTAASLRLRVHSPAPLMQQEPWLVINATGEARRFDEKEMRRRLAAGAINNTDVREWQIMTAIAAVLDHERANAARINKTEL